jgi:YD repeat-containing protein
VANSFSETRGYTYDGGDKLKTQTNANGTSTAYMHNELRGWPSSITTRTLQARSPATLTCDTGSNTVGNLTGVTEHDGSTASYGYDALYRLLGESRSVAAS